MYASSNSMFQLHRILKGIKWTSSSQQRFRSPITIHILSKFSTLLRPNFSEDLDTVIIYKLNIGGTRAYSCSYVPACKMQVPDFFNVTPLSHMHATMTDFTYSFEKNYYKNNQIIITLISKIDLIVYIRITFFSYHPTVCFTIAF